MVQSGRYHRFSGGIRTGNGVLFLVRLVISDGFWVWFYESFAITARLAAGNRWMFITVSGFWKSIKYLTADKNKKRHSRSDTVSLLPYDVFLTGHTV